MSGDTIYLFLVYAYSLGKKILILPLYSYLYVDIIFEARSKGLVMLLLRFSSTLRNKDNKGMFGNCFFPSFYVFKNSFLFLRLKNLFGNPE